MDILTDVLDRVRLKGTVLSPTTSSAVPWSVALPRSPDAIFHYLSRGSASVDDSRVDRRFGWRRAIASSLSAASPPRPPVGSEDEADPAGRSRSVAGACRPRPSRRWGKAVFDDDVWSLQSVTPNTRQCAGIATAGPALEARGGSSPRKLMSGPNEKLVAMGPGCVERGRYERHC